MMDTEEKKMAFWAVVVLILLLAGLYLIKVESCEQRSISFEKHNYGGFSGCMVFHNEKWLPLENIRGFDDK
jgi:hypothetical protein